LRAASSYEEHAAALERCLQGLSPVSTEERQFVLDFVRPGGTSRSATEIACEALEAAAKLRRVPISLPDAWMNRMLERFVLEPLSREKLARGRSVKKTYRPGKDEKALLP
jgi:hypothetical protein